MKYLYILLLGLIIYYIISRFYEKYTENFDPSLVPVSSIVTLAKVAQKIVDGGGTLTSPGNLTLGTPSNVGNLLVTGNSTLGTPGSTSLIVNGDTNMNSNLQFNSLSSYNNTISFGTPINLGNTYIANTPTPTQVIVNGQTTLQSNTWHKTTDGGNRLFYADNDSSYYNCPQSTHTFQTNKVTTMSIDDKGNLSNLGNINTNDTTIGGVLTIGNGINQTLTSIVNGSLNIKNNTDSTNTGLAVGDVTFGNSKLCIKSNLTWYCINAANIDTLNIKYNIT